MSISNLGFVDGYGMEAIGGRPLYVSLGVSYGVSGGDLNRKCGFIIDENGLMKLRTLDEYNRERSFVKTRYESEDDFLKGFDIVDDVFTSRLEVINEVTHKPVFTGRVVDDFKAPNFPYGLKLMRCGSRECCVRRWKDRVIKRDGEAVFIIPFEITPPNKRGLYLPQIFEHPAFLAPYTISKYKMVGFCRNDDGSTNYYGVLALRSYSEVIFCEYAPRSQSRGCIRISVDDSQIFVDGGEDETEPFSINCNQSTFSGYSNEEYGNHSKPIKYGDFSLFSLF